MGGPETEDSKDERTEAEPDGIVAFLADRGSLGSRVLVPRTEASQSRAGGRAVPLCENHSAPVSVRFFIC